MLTPNGLIMTDLGSPRTPNHHLPVFLVFFIAVGPDSKKTPGDVSWQV